MPCDLNLDQGGGVYLLQQSLQAGDGVSAVLQVQFDAADKMPEGLHHSPISGIRHSLHIVQNAGLAEHREVVLLVVVLHLWDQARLIRLFLQHQFVLEVVQLNLLLHTQIRQGAVALIDSRQQQR